MLKTLPGRPPAQDADLIGDRPFTSQLAKEYLDFGLLLAAARRRWRGFLACTLVAVALAALYLLIAPSRFTASADIFLDHHSNLLPDTNTPLATLFDTEATTLSQIEIVKSDGVLGRVVDDLKLVDDPRFDADSKSLLAPLWSAAKPLTSLILSLLPDRNSKVDQSALRSRAIDLLGKNLSVTRTGQTYVIDVTYTSKSPELAADIVNAIAQVYLGEELRSLADTGNKASQWLDARIAEIKQQSLAADLAVQTFSAQSGLVVTGGQLVTDQKLATLNAMLLQAKSDTAKSEAQYKRLQDIIASGQTDASVADALISPVINNLQTRYSEAAQREHQIAARFGSGHAEAIRLRNEMADDKRQMFDELSRIANTYQSDLAMARGRQERLQQQFDDATTASLGANKSQVQLRALQLESDNYRALYQAYLQRYQQLRQQQTFPVSDARIISAAHVPLEPSLPRKPLVLAIFAAAGIFIGLATAAIKEAADRSLHTAADVRRHIGLRFLGYFEDFAPKRRHGFWRETRMARRPSPASPLQIAVDRPLSVSAETLRSSLMALTSRATSEPLVIGMLSALPAEGTTSLAINFAATAAVLGRRTLLITSNDRNPGSAARTHLENARPYSSSTLPDAGLVKLSLSGHAGTYACAPAPLVEGAVTDIAGMSTLINEARNTYDVIVVDLPASALQPDARLLVDDIDAFVLVVAWGHTSRDTLQTLLRDNVPLAEKCAGVILNRTDLSRLSTYQGLWSGEPSFADRSRLAFGTQA